LLAAPLLLVFLWPTLPQEMVPPIEARPADLQLAAELARLPEDAVILSLPMNLEPWSAAVDERVLVHRRRQIAAFASVIPEPFRYARLALGQWPYAGADAAQALKATYAVAPIAWVERARTLLEREGYREIATAGGRVVLALPSGQAVDHLEVAVPPVAAADRWLTLSVTSSTPRFDARGHRTLEARWEAAGEVTTAEAHAFVPGLGSAGPPVRIHVPTPHEPGRYTLTIEAKEVRVRAQVDVHPLATSLDAPIDDVTVSLAGDFALPAFVRAGEPARIDVEIAAGPEAPVLLASSRCDLPERCGEVAVEYRYTLPNRMQATATTPPRSVLSRDLVPGERRREGVYLRMPPIEGRVALDIRLRAIGREAQTGWSRLFDRIEVRRD
jgi:hypothetical protein